MTRKRIPLRAVLLLDLLGVTVSASAISANRLFGRADTCPANFSRCQPETLPPDFCCPPGQQCMALAGNTTLVCCPVEDGCTIIRPISCQISLQDGDKHPTALIKTTALNGVLGHCGSGTCCPFGYSCADNGICKLDADQDAKPSQSSVPPTSTSPPATSTGTIPEASASETRSAAGAGHHDGSGAGASTVTPVTTDNPKKGTSPAVIAGASVAAGLLTLALAFAAFLFFKRRNKKKAEEMDTLKLTRSTSSFGNIISNPIMSDNSTWRTDFARKSREGASLGSGFSKRSSTTSMTGLVNAGNDPSTPSPARTRDGSTQAAVRIPPIRTMARQSSIAYGYGAPETSPYGNGANYHARDHEASAPYPQTPPQQREPSSISINVFADPQTVGTEGNNTGSRRFSHMTTFSDMLRSADLGGVSRGEPFVPSPSNLSPMTARR